MGTLLGSKAALLTATRTDNGPPSYFLSLATDRTRSSCLGRVIQLSKSLGPHLSPSMLAVRFQLAHGLARILRLR